MRHHEFPGLSAFAILALIPTARAQQFQQVTLFPDGAGSYSEGVVCADVDQDGDLDIIVADGDGATSGASRQNKLYVNKLIETATPYSLVDESVARFGANLSNAKGVTAGDVNGDGWVDILFSNSNNQAPSLYINQGASNPGFFTLESATRGFTALYLSGSAQFLDVDDDGDQDVVVNDGFNSGTAKRAHLFVNNGSGVFTENIATFIPPLRALQMSVHVADVDNDYDVDIFGFTKLGTAGASHMLMLNNGTGGFSDSSSSITPASGACYEADVADLDNDNDIDMFFVSLSGFAEGAVRNNIVPSAALTFTTLAAFGGDDDNEISFLDYDNDGDYDVLVGSLGASEKFYTNNGSATFALAAGLIQAQADSTLDCTVADLNNDGAYEVITVQGESGSFRNKFYKNTGSADTRAPVLVGEQVPVSAPSGSAVVVHAKIRDQALDDGQNYVTPSGDYVVLTAPAVAAVSIDPGAFNPPVLNVNAGTTVTWTNNSGGSQSVKSTTAPYTYDSGTLAAAATYSRTFVKPGTYTYTSIPGGFSATVNVGGASNAIVATPMGGQEYRFRMPDTAGGLGILLCWELRFRDWPGNVLVAPSHCLTLTGSLTGTGFCFGDGTGTACPCGNTALVGSGTGCLSSLGFGGRVSASGVSSLSADTALLSGQGMPNSSALYFQGTVQQGGGAGVAFGDGLRCAGGAVIRLGTKTNVGNASSYPVGGDLPISVKGLVVAPGSRHYQVWYRNAAAFCQPETFNLTNGWTISWSL